jgi:hypothetical protein
MCDKQRLIELLGCNKFNMWSTEQLADFLLSHGVTVLPKGVGETVYYINGNNYITRHKIAGYTIDKNGVKVDLGNFTTNLNSERLFFYLSDAERVRNNGKL